jgi:hypothetical protein
MNRFCAKLRIVFQAATLVWYLWLFLREIWCYLCGTVERVEEREIVEIANFYAGFMHLAEKMVG